MRKYSIYDIEDGDIDICNEYSYSLCIPPSVYSGVKFGSTAIIHYNSHYYLCRARPSLSLSIGTAIEVPLEVIPTLLGGARADTEQCFYVFDSVQELNEAEIAIPCESNVSARAIASFLLGAPLCVGAVIRSPVLAVTCGGVFPGVRVIAASASFALKERRGAGTVPQAGVAPLFAGYEQSLAKLTSVLRLFSQTPDDLAARRFRPPRGALVIGASGSGKTALVTRAASDAGLPVVRFAPYQAARSDAAPEAALMRAVAEAAVTARNTTGAAILVIQDIDILCPDRSLNSTAEHETRLVSAFLGALDRKDIQSSVFVVGETSAPEAVDPALRRTGRLELDILLTAPTLEERGRILELYAPGDMSDALRSEYETLPERTSGYLPADLCALVHEIEVRGSVAEALRHTRPSILRVAERFADLPPGPSLDGFFGCEQLVQDAREAVVWPLTRAAEYERLGMQPPRGALIFGVAGTGKTALACALARELERSGHARHLLVRGPELFSPFVGETEAGLRRVFANARRMAPCLVILDEVDAVAPQRSSGQHELVARVVATLLTELDGLQSAADIIVLATTSRPGSVDAALLRPGRLDSLVWVQPMQTREQVNAVIRGAASSLGLSAPDSADILADLCIGCTQADVIQAIHSVVIETGALSYESLQQRLAAVPHPDAESSAAVELFANEHGLFSADSGTL